jgi:hypothetical protein
MDWAGLKPPATRSERLRARLSFAYFRLVMAGYAQELGPLSRPIPNIRWNEVVAAATVYRGCKELGRSESDSMSMFFQTLSICPVLRAHVGEIVGHPAGNKILEWLPADQRDVATADIGKVVLFNLTWASKQRWITYKPANAAEWILTIWGNLLDPRVASEDLGDYWEAIRARADIEQKPRLLLHVLRAVVWTACNSLRRRR